MDRNPYKHTFILQSPHKEHIIDFFSALGVEEPDDGIRSIGSYYDDLLMSENGWSHMVVTEDDHLSIQVQSFGIDTIHRRIPKETRGMYGLKFIQNVEEAYQRDDLTLKEAAEIYFEKTYEENHGRALDPSFKCRPLYRSMIVDIMSHIPQSLPLNEMLYHNSGVRHMHEIIVKINEEMLERHTRLSYDVIREIYH